jgi:hypothetical protein
VSTGVSRTGALTATCQIRSARLVVSRVAMAGSFWVTSAARAQIDFAQAIATVIGGISGAATCCSSQSSKWSGPAQMHPSTVWGRPGWRCDRHHTFGTIFDTQTRDGRQAADVPR